jgi:hypothetical protein
MNSFSATLQLLLLLTPEKKLVVTRPSLLPVALAALRRSSCGWNSGDHSHSGGNGSRATRRHLGPHRGSQGRVDLALPRSAPMTAMIASVRSYTFWRSLPQISS